MLLELMVASAPAAEVASAGPPALIPGQGVVQVGPPGRLSAGREPAGHIPGGYVFPEPGRGPVGPRFALVSASAGRLVSLCLSPRLCQRPGCRPKRGGGDPARRARSAGFAGSARSAGPMLAVGDDVLADGDGNPADQSRPRKRAIPGQTGGLAGRTGALPAWIGAVAGAAYPSCRLLARARRTASRTSSVAPSHVPATFSMCSRAAFLRWSYLTRRPRRKPRPITYP